jgi:predicted glycosyltransferase
MKALIEIVHPADVLFFSNPIRRLNAMGHVVTVVSRDKDVALPLLEALGLSHHCLSRAGRGVSGLGWELIRRDISLWRLVKNIRPDVMCGFGGVSISHVGKLLGIPTISFYDTDRAPLQHALSLPFIDRLYVPAAYTGPTARNRTVRFPGTKDLSFFHPENFEPDRQIALKAGLDPERDNYFIRLVGWGANHDLGRSGWAEATLRSLIGALLPRGKIHLSSEPSLPADFAKYGYRGPVLAAHHLLACCTAYIGESATMACEASLLGIPAIYAADDPRSYIDELAEAGLVWTVPEVTPARLRNALSEIETCEKSEFEQRRRTYLADKPNLADYIVTAILQHARTGAAPIGV